MGTDQQIENESYKRTELVIIEDILSIISTHPKGLTHIMYKSNLSYSRLRRYLTMLARMELIEEFEAERKRRKFRITEKGMVFHEIIQTKTEKKKD